MNDASCQNGRWNGQNDTMDHSNLTRPLPEITTENTTDINTSDKSLVVDDVNIDQPEDEFAEENITIPDKPIKTKKQNIPYQKIINLYEEILPELPQVNMLTESRKSHIRARWNDHIAHQSLEYWKDYFLLVKKTPFLLGKVPANNGRKAFRANIDWLINPTNFVKVTEGYYE